MKSHLSGDRFANKVRMLRSLKDNVTFLLVEGATDKRFYGKFINRDSCEIIAANSKGNAIRCVDILTASGVEGVLAIVDADFMHLEDEHPESPNVLVTDTHDIETLILRSSALEDILVEYSEDARMDAFLNRVNMGIRELIAKNGSAVGALRWISLRSDAGLRFDDLPFASCMNPETCEVDVPLLIQATLDNSRSPRMEVLGNMNNRVNGILDDQHNPWLLSCGHDLVEFLLILLKKEIGSYNAGKLNKGELEGDLRLAFDEAHFQMTKLYESLLLWEQRNTPFRVLPNDGPSTESGSGVGDGGARQVG